MNQEDRDMLIEVHTDMKWIKEKLSDQIGRAHV